MSRELTLVYVNGAQIGYGRLGVYLYEGLRKRGVKVFNDPGHDSATAPGGLDVGSRDKAPVPTNLLCLVSVPSHMLGFFDNQHRAIVTMWEAMTLPPAFRENFHEFETMIVPSRQNQELFSRFHDNVQYMPLGVDNDLWHYLPPSEPTNEFRFLISGRGNRKGNDLAFRAFREVFSGVTSGPTPRLLMKSRTGHQDYYGPGIEQITGTLEPVAERDLYASAHCYVQPSRGEGFGLQPLQALALGRPTILTNAHGHESYADLGIGLDWEPVPSEEFLHGDAGLWWEPDYDGLCEAMWDVYKNYAAHAERAKASAAVVARDWTWDRMVDRFIEILGPEMDLPYLGEGAWVPSTRQLYKTVLVRDYAHDIAGRTVTYRKGREYWEPADVKRILFDGGLLDPICLNDDDHGLAPQQADQLGLYRAMHEPCPTCHRVCACESAADRIERQMIEEEEMEAASS